MDEGRQWVYPGGTKREAQAKEAQDIIMAFFEGKGGSAYSADELQGLLDLRRDTLRKQLNELVKEGRLDTQGVGKRGDPRKFVRRSWS